LSKENFFGNEEIQHDIPRKFNVRCISSEGTLYHINKSDFNRIILPHNRNRTFFLEHSKEINKYIQERIDSFTQKNEKDILQKFKIQEKEFSFAQQRNNNDLDYEFNRDEMKLFFSNAILKNKEQHVMKIFSKQNELMSIPKLFEHSLKENKAVFKRGLISQLKFKKKKTQSFLNLMTLKESHPSEKKFDTLENHPETPNNKSQQFFLPRKFSLPKNDYENSFQSFFLRKGLNSSSSRLKNSNNQSKESVSNLVVSSSKSFFNNKNSKDKLGKILNHKEKKYVNPKGSLEEEYGFKEFLPLKYQAKSIRDYENRNKMQRALSHSLIKKKFLESFN